MALSMRAPCLTPLPCNINRSYVEFARLLDECGDYATPIVDPNDAANLSAAKHRLPLLTYTEMQRIAHVCGITDFGE
jgi:hypothetical protein